MSSSALLRPGIAVGAYPQRADIRDGWLDRTAAAGVGALRQWALGRRPRYRRFIDAVEDRARGLATCSEAELQAAIGEVRRRLYSRGLRRELVAESFAIVREVATRELGLRHYDVQLFGGWVMLQGKLAEMETGEGKTLTATLPAATAALAGIPVHIVTVNDFLVERDADWMAPIYRRLGIGVGTIVEGMDATQRRTAYACDVVYCTNKQLVFDYLKDQILLARESRPLHLQLEGLYSERPRTEQLLMRGLCFAIVDEADSVLVDEARTPLIISNAGDSSQEERTFHEAIAVASKMRAPRDFTVRARDRRIDLTDLGRAQLLRLTRPLGGVWSGLKRREELAHQALAALHLYHRDKDYLVRDEAIQIVDEYTGRVMADRSWERGLHQMIEAKEGCPITSRQETLARISYQRFFRRYLRLAGMTGTCREVASELWSVYRLNVVTVPTNRPTRRRAFAQKIFPTTEAKWQAVVERVGALHRLGVPVLIGTRSVAASEHLSELLNEVGLPHRVLNARQDEEEAEIVARAGEASRITVATNMAGRGTDIRLADGVAELGGLFVLATERHEARRIDRQLFGRSGRQGDPGAYQAIVSLEDELVRGYFGGRLDGLIDRRRRHGRPLPGWLAAPLVALAQKAAEFRHSRARRDLLRVDENLGDMLAFSGRGE